MQQYGEEIQRKNSSEVKNRKDKDMKKKRERIKEGGETHQTEKADGLKRGMRTISHKCLKDQKKLESDGGVGK